MKSRRNKSLLGFLLSLSAAYVQYSHAFVPNVINNQHNQIRAREMVPLVLSASTTPEPETNTVAVKGPSFLAALFGIAINGSPWEYMLRMKEQGYDGVVPVDLGIIGKYNFLLSPETVRAATVEEAKILPRRFSVPLFEQLELDKGIVYEQGNRHKRNKKLCIPSFEQSRSMECFCEVTKKDLDEFSREFMAHSDKGKMIDLYAEMRRLALDVVLEVSFGATEFERADELSQTIAEYLERIVALANEIPPLWQIAPRLSANYVRVTDVVLPNLRNLVAEVIAVRRALELQRVENGNGNEEGALSATSAMGQADLLGVLVGQLDDDDIQSILFDIVIAGSDTTASTSTASIYILHRPENKYWLDRARQEADETNAGREIPLNDLRSKMPVTVAIAREVLRLYPPVPFVGRTATENGSLDDGDEEYPVKIGDTFCFSPWFLGRDKSEWGASAEEFDPQRWIDDPTNGGARSNFSWLPFGAGARGCLGTRLGLTEVVLGVARLVQDFEFEFKTTGPLPVKYDLTLNLDGSMDCQIKPREV